MCPQGCQAAHFLAGLLAIALPPPAAATQPPDAEEALAAFPPQPPLILTSLPLTPADAAPTFDDRDLLDLLGLRQPDAPAQPSPNELMMFVLPAFGVNPSIGVAVGVGATAALALGHPENTTVSNLSASAMWTTKGQFVSSAKSVILTPSNEWELLGDLRFYRYSEPTYGLGTAQTLVSGGFALNGMETAELPGAQPLKYQFVKIHETAFRHAAGFWYAGVGYHLDLHSNIVDELLDTSAVPPVVTSHYAYSKLEGFDPTQYVVSGVSLNALYESRDHTLDAYRGMYLHLSYRVAPTWLGSTRASSRVYGEFRTYLPLTDRPRHLLAMWLFGDGIVRGAVPYLDLPAVGYDTRGRSGRGYAAGRFRGTALVYGEVEYRFPLSGSGLFGGVAFVNATTAARPRVEVPSLGVNDPGVSLFQSVKPGAGAGLRIMADRRARMNLAVDLGFGAGGSSGLYLSMGETF